MCCGQICRVPHAESGSREQNKKDDSSSRTSALHPTRRKPDMSSTDLWGEIPSAGPAVTLSTAEKEALCRLPRPLQLKGPKLHQPGRRRQVKEAEGDKKMEESVLLRCARLQKALKNPEGAAAREVLLAPITLERAGPFDTKYFLDDEEDDGEEETAVKTEEGGKQGMRKSRRRRRPHRVAPSNLTSAAASEALRRSTAEVMSAAGFTAASDVALQVATDTTVEVMRRFCLRLREARESGQAGNGGGGGSGFADCLERALAESGGHLVAPQRDQFAGVGG